MLYVDGMKSVKSEKCDTPGKVYKSFFFVERSLLLSSLKMRRSYS